MNVERCAECPLASCSRLARYGYEAGCRTFLEVKRGLPESRSAANQAPPPRKLLPVSEARRLRELIRACPHFTPKAAGDPCGCMGRCSAGRGDLREGRTSWKNCLECRAEAYPPPG